MRIFSVACRADDERSFCAARAGEMLGQGGVGRKIDEDVGVVEMFRD